MVPTTTPGTAHATPGGERGGVFANLSDDPQLAHPDHLVSVPHPVRADPRTERPGGFIRGAPRPVAATRDVLRERLGRDDAGIDRREREEALA